MLDQFDAAIQRLEAVKSDLDSYLATTGIVEPEWRFNAGIATFDILSICAILRPIHQEAVTLTQEQTRRFAASQPPIAVTAHLNALFHHVFETEDENERQKRAAEYMRQQQQLAPLDLDDAVTTARMTQAIDTKLMITYKSLFYFVRVHQDAMYCVLRRLVGLPVSKAYEKRSLGTVLLKDSSPNPNHPVAKVLTTRLPDYIPWFIRWRDRRNKVKEGVQFSIAGPAENIGIGFTRLDYTTGGLIVDCAPENAVRLSDVVEALTQCADIMKLCLDCDKEKSDAS